MYEKLKYLWPPFIKKKKLSKPPKGTTARSEAIFVSSA